MKICILGLDSATPQIAFQDERLVNLRRLMELGVYGELPTVMPPETVPGWMSLVTSRDPGSLGVYGLCNRADHSYASPSPATSQSLKAPSLWDQVAAAGKKTILQGVPPNFPPRTVDGISIACCLAGHSLTSEFTVPAGVISGIRQLIGDYAADVSISAAGDKNELRQQIFEMSRKQWEVARWLLREQEWDYFHFVDIGLNRVQRAFWDAFDEQHPRYQPESPYQSVIADYYLWLDEQVGSVLELLDEETLVLVASANGMQRLHGAIAINQWLIEQGLLVLNRTPMSGITPFAQLDVNWAKTKAWSGDGVCAPLYFNVQGRETQGIVSAAQCQALSEEIKSRLQSLRDPQNRPLSTLVLNPREIYRETSDSAPDLIVQLGEGSWRALGSIGHPGLHVALDNEGCNPASPGLFVLVAPNCPLAGEYTGAHLLDMAPTILDLAGYEIPATMQGRSLVAGMEKKRDAGPDSDQIILDRLAGLGYV